MAAYDFAAPRLFVDADLATDAVVELGAAASGYLTRVLRLGEGASVLAFNGRDGEWTTRVRAGRRQASLAIVEQVRPQPPAPDLLYLFAPLKHARLDYMVQKATEMGAGALRPVFTARTVPSRVNEDRMRANAVEAAEQCGILSVPAILPPLDLSAALGTVDSDRLLVFCDEDAPPGDPHRALSACKPAVGGLAVLIGPEGGFGPDERERLSRHPNAVRISLGPRILRADTAAVAALAVVQSALGDWS
jgi:16S rRNA (uracil1498-N3)-methyltransferase